jgi:hypothetical protein
VDNWPATLNCTQISRRYSPPFEAASRASGSTPFDIQASCSVSRKRDINSVRLFSIAFAKAAGSR